MPVSDISLFNSLTAALDQTSSQLQTTEQQVATGKLVNQPSDDPVAYAQTELLAGQQAATTNDVSLANQAQSRLTTIDAALSQISYALDSAIQQAAQGADGSINPTQMAALGQAVNGLLSQVIGIANTQYAGAYVFSGNKVLTAPYSPTGVYSGDTNSNSVVLSDGTSLQLSFNGQSIFGDATSGTIGDLTALANALNAGNHSAVAATLPQLQAALQQIATARSAIGTTMNAAAAAATNGNSNLLTLASAINNVSGLDVAQAAMTFQEQSVQQQALVALSSALGKMPLVNILA
jgi:flagellar hook-associated protein 3 FlgL